MTIEIPGDRLTAAIEYARVMDQAGRESDGPVAIPAYLNLNLKPM